MGDRQPGYGSSYITGRYQIERLLVERSDQLGNAFKLPGFFAEVDAAGVIPVSLISQAVIDRGRREPQSAPFPFSWWADNEARPNEERRQ